MKHSITIPGLSFEGRAIRDWEKIPTTPVTKLQIEDIDVTSRYQKADELQIMVGAILALHVEFRQQITSIFCDSKACAVYEVILKSWNRRLAQEIGDVLDQWFYEHHGGHNSIIVMDASRNSERQVWMNPNWKRDNFFRSPQTSDVRSLRTKKHLRLVSSDQPIKRLKRPPRSNKPKRLKRPPRRPRTPGDVA